METRINIRLSRIANVLLLNSGIVLSVLLILHEFEVHLAFTDKLCHLNKATNCNTVLHDKASKVFGWFGWADAGFVYFTAVFSFFCSLPREKDFLYWQY